MKYYSLKKSEILSIVIILVVIFASNFFNFKISERKARDNQRNLDVSAIAAGIELYKNDYGVYPLSSSDGRIIACQGPETALEKDKAGYYLYNLGAKKPKLTGLVACNWGQDALLDVTDINYPHYLSLIPQDPQADLGAEYHYISNGTQFQVFGSFEGKNLREYNPEILTRNLTCGIRICTFGKASLGVPLEKSLQ